MLGLVIEQLVIKIAVIDQIESLGILFRQAQRYAVTELIGLRVHHLEGWLPQAFLPVAPAPLAKLSAAGRVLL